MGTKVWVLFWSGPPRPNRNTPTQITIQLSMIVEITSWAPTVALRKPAIPAQSAPTESACDRREEDVQQRVHAAERRADPDSEHGADDVLALTADVEHAATECECDGETREDQRRRQDECLLPVLGCGRPLDTVTHGKNQLNPAPSKIAR